MTKGNRNPTSVKWLLALTTFVGLVVTCEAADLFVVSRQGTAAANEIYRYRIDSALDKPSAPDRVITDSSLDVVSGLAFSPQAELFVTNTKTHYGTGSISRFLNPGGIATPNGVIRSTEFSGPLWAIFRNKELIVPQYGGRNVLRFVFDASGNAIPSGKIPYGQGALQGIAIRPGTGELFVSSNNGSIQRFLFDSSGNAVPNGEIRGYGLGDVHDMVFTPWGELLVANQSVDGVLRFVFDAAGNASPNGRITGSTLNWPLGLALSPWGELFVSNQYGGPISRWLFDSSFNAIPNGSFWTPGTSIIDIEFSPGPPSCDGVLPKLSALVSSKTGTQEARTWTIALTNKSSCPAEKAQIDGLKLTQTYGVACTPVISSPASFPLSVGDIAAGGKASGAVTINFSGCDVAARFSARITYSANDGAVKGAKTLNNQFR